ncbi:MAG: molybdopterin molybdotransferase MoeA, partial [Acidimicrobiales bacterium]
GSKAADSRPGQAVRHAGEDVVVGQTLVEPGDVIGPALVGALASQGVQSLTVHPAPRVGVLSTGDEIVDGSSPLAPGHIRDANRPALVASLRQSGFSPVDLGHVGDSKQALREAFEHAARECDAVISTGGVSAGDADFVKVVLAELFGDAARSMQVAMRPGKPFTYAYDETTATPYFALAGNPVSTLVGFEFFVRPALRRLAGHRDLERTTWPMILDRDIARARDGKVHLIHAICYLHEDGRLHVRLVARTGSHLLFAVADANCLLVSPDSDGLVAGDVVSGIILDESRVTSTSGQ